MEYWGTQAPVRLTFLFALTGYTYTFKEGGMFAPRTADYKMSAGASLNNSVIFAWGFFELVAWFWVCLGLIASLERMLMLTGIRDAARRATGEGSKDYRQAKGGRIETVNHAQSYSQERRGC